MTQLVPFDSAKVPAHIKAKGTIVNAFAAAKSAGGFPVVSIKGKVFHIARGDERTLVTKPGEDDEPASSLEIVIVGVNPNKSKIYYTGGYVEGSTDKPTCYSSDGVTPAADSATPQSKKCATCAHNVWGSKITESGKKTKACTDSMRLAVAPAGQLNDPMLLRVPAATLGALGEYGALLQKRGVEPHQVVTKVGFDYTVAHPALTFKPVGFVSDAMMEEIDEIRASELVANITGTAPTAPLDEEAFEQAAPVVEAPKPVKAPKPAKALEVEAAPEDAPAPAPKAAKAEAKVVETVAELEQALDDIDFD